MRARNTKTTILKTHRLIVGSVFSARFTHSLDKQVSRVTKCLAKILYTILRKNRFVLL